MNPIEIIHIKTEELIKEYIIHYLDELYNNQDESYNYYMSIKEDINDHILNDLECNLFKQFGGDSGSDFYNYVENNYNEESRYKLNEDFTYILQYVVEFEFEFDDIEPEDFTNVELIINYYALRFILEDNKKIIYNVLKNYEDPEQFILK